MPLNALFWFCVQLISPPPISPPPYVAIVVDASTSKPLHGVTVRSLTNSTVVLTDKNGRFKLTDEQPKVRLSMLGYADLEISGRPVTDGQTDTLRLLPRALTLDDVVVKPGKLTVVSTVRPKVKSLSYGLVAGQAWAVLLMPPPQAPTGQACLVDQVNLFLTNRPVEGRLRIRLVNIVPIAASPGAMRPGVDDLLPEPILFSPEDMRRAPRGLLKINLSKYQLLLPPQGLCVVVECLPTNLTDQVVTVRHEAKGKDLVVLSADPSNPAVYHTVEAKEYPLFASIIAPGGGNTWNRLEPTASWRRQGGTIQVELRVDLELYTY